MVKDLRTYMQDLKEKCPDEFIAVSKEVESKFEATTLLRKLELQGKEPMAVFEKAKALDGTVSKYPLVFNAFSTRTKLCVALGMDPAQNRMELPMELNKLYANRGTLLTIDPKDAPVKEVIKTGDDAGFYEFPIPVHHEKDGGPYILAGSIVTRDPDSGNHNLAMIRIHIKDNKMAAIHAEPHHHTGMIIKKYGEMGKPAPIAVVIGHHPGFFLGSQHEGSFGSEEYELASSALQQPVRLVPSETWGSELMVPADAEMIFECEVDWNDRIEEGPLGEHTRYYKNLTTDGKYKQQMDPKLMLKAVTMRKDAYFQSLFIGHSEHYLIGSIPKEAVIYERVRMTCPGIKQVHMAPGGTGRYLCFLSLKQRVGGEARDAAMAAMSCDWHIKYVVVCDDDVDVYSDTEVLWAIATRTQPDKAIVIIPGAMGATVDPTVDSATKISSKCIIDCTKSVTVPFSQVCEVPLDMLNNMKLEDYLK